MIIDNDLIASYDFMTDFNGLNRHFEKSLYPSGLNDYENPIYKFGPKSSDYPNLLLPCSLYDELGNEIPQGYYMVALSMDKKFLELYQSNEMRARVKVVKLIEKMYTQEELSEEADLKDKLYKAQEKHKYKQVAKAQEDLDAFNERKAAESYAEILDSGDGYYILNYNNYGKKATGIIQK